ncbi:hypothetical protein Hanom_Chr02g00118861 [Helianthus anomalus]
MIWEFTYSKCSITPFTLIKERQTLLFYFMLEKLLELRRWQSGCIIGCGCNFGKINLLLIY